MKKYASAAFSLLIATSASTLSDEAAAIICKYDGPEKLFAAINEEGSFTY
jgi:hypothetical protein